jgi:hypothetical protein
MTVIWLSRRSLVSRSRIPVAVCESRLPVRLVGQQQVRGVDHGPGDGDSLLFAA